MRVYGYFSKCVSRQVFQTSLEVFPEMRHTNSRYIYVSHSSPSPKNVCGYGLANLSLYIIIEHRYMLCMIQGGRHLTRPISNVLLRQNTIVQGYPESSMLRIQIGCPLLLDKNVWVTTLRELDSNKRDRFRK